MQDVTYPLDYDYVYVLRRNDGAYLRMSTSGPSWNTDIFHCFQLENRVAAEQLRIQQCAQGMPCEVVEIALQ